MPVGEQAEEAVCIGNHMTTSKKVLHQHQRNTLVSILMAGGISISPQTYAQSAAEMIVVSGSRFEENIDRIPANIQVITREQIQQSTSSNLSEVLQQLGNAPMPNQTGSLLGVGATPNFGGYSIGAASSNTLILLNGVRLNPVDQGFAPLNIVPLAAIERIEIINGGASVLFGNNATGGVINIITVEGEKSASQAAVSYGSFGTLITDIAFNKRSEDTSINLSASSSKTNGWRENSDALTSSMNGRITRHLGRSDKVFIEAYAYHLQSSYPYIIAGAEVGKGNPYLVNAGKKGSGLVQDGSSVRTGIARGLGDDVVFEMEASLGTTSSSARLNESFGFDAVVSEKRQFDLTPRVKMNWGQWGSSIVGYDFNQSGVDGQGDNSFFGISSSAVELKNQSIFLQQRLPMNDVLEWVGGVRRQKQDASLSTVNKFGSNYAALADGTYVQSYYANAYELGLNYRYALGQRVFARYDQSYRFANVDDYFGFNPNTNQNYLTGIPLRPQTNQTAELGGDFSWQRTRLTFGVFQTNTQDEIRYDPINGTNINDENIRRVGINLNSTTQILTNVDMGFGLRYQQARYAEGVNHGKDVPLAPQTLINLRIKYQWSTPLAVGGVVNLVGKQYYDADITNSQNTMPTYAFGDVYVQYKKQAWEGRLTVKNVTNTQYAVYANYLYGAYNYQPAPPRALIATIKYNF